MPDPTDGAAATELLAWLLACQGTAAASAVYTFAGRPIEVTASAAGVIGAVDAVVRPFFGATAPGPPLARVQVTETPVPDRVLEILDAGDTIHLQSNRRRGEIVRVEGRRLRLPDGGHAIRPLRNRVVCGLWPAAGRLAVIGERPAAVTQLVLKDLFRRAAWTDTVSLHAAAVSAGGRAVLISGGSGSGKTTLALSACFGQGAGYIASDRSVLTTRSGCVDVAGWPTYVRVAPGSLSRAELAPLSRVVTDVENAKHVVPAGALRDAGVRLEGGPTPVGVCLFPRLVDRDSGLVRLTEADGAAALAAVLHTWPEPLSPHWTGWFDAEPAAPDAASLIRRLASQAHLFEARLALGDDWPLRAWLRAEGVF